MSQSAVKTSTEAIVASGGLCAPLAPIYGEHSRGTLASALAQALATGPNVRGLGMIAVYPEIDEASALVVEDGHSPEKMHVTMVFLGEIADIDMDAAAEAVANVASRTEPLSGEVGGLGVFGAGDDGYPQIAFPDVSGLSTLRTRIVDALAEKGIISTSTHDWVPHLTLSYVEEPALADMAIVGKGLTFNSLSLTANDVRIDYPFKSSDESSSEYSFTRSEQRRKQMLIDQAREIA